MPEMLKPQEPQQPQQQGDKLKQVPRKVAPEHTFFEIKGVFSNSSFKSEQLYKMFQGYQPKGEKCVDDFLSWLKKNGKPLEKEFQEDLKDGKIKVEFPSGMVGKEYDKSTKQKAVTEAKKSIELKFVTMGVWLGQRYAAELYSSGNGDELLPIHSRVSLPDAVTMWSGGASFNGSFNPRTKDIVLSFPISNLLHGKNGQSALSMGFSLGFHESVHGLAAMQSEQGSYKELATYAAITSDGLFLKEEDVNEKNWFLSKRNSLVLLGKINQKKISVETSSFASEYMAYLAGPYIQSHMQRKGEKLGVSSLEPNEHVGSIALQNLMDILQDKGEYSAGAKKMLLEGPFGRLFKEQPADLDLWMKSYLAQRTNAYKKLGMEEAETVSETKVGEIARAFLKAEGLRGEHGEVAEKLTSVFQALWKAKVTTLEDFLKIFQKEMDLQFGKPEVQQPPEGYALTYPKNSREKAPHELLSKLVYRKNLG